MPAWHLAVSAAHAMTTMPLSMQAAGWQLGPPDLPAVPLAVTIDLVALIAADRRERRAVDSVAYGLYPNPVGCRYYCRALLARALTQRPTGIMPLA